MALNAVTGDEVWRTPRDEGSSWNTPLLYVKGNTGIWSALDADTGDPFYPAQRLDDIGDVYS